MLLSIGTDMEGVAAMLDPIAMYAVVQFAAEQLETLYQCAQQPQRADVAVQCTIDGAHHLGADMRGKLFHALRVQRFKRIVASERILQAFQVLHVSTKFSLVKKV